jgi:primosomal protein N'
MWLVVNETVTVSVAVDQSVFQTDRPYDYLLPTQFQGCAKPGCRVLIPFGNGNIKKTGMILGFSQYDGNKKLKSVISVLDYEPVLSEDMLKLAAFIREQTFCTWYNAIRVLLPPGINYKVREEYVISELYDSVKDTLGSALLQVAEYINDYSSPVTKEKIYSTKRQQTFKELFNNHVGLKKTIKEQDLISVINEVIASITHQLYNQSIPLQLKDLNHSFFYKKDITPRKQTMPI